MMVAGVGGYYSLPTNATSPPQLMEKGRGTHLLSLTDQSWDNNRSAGVILEKV